MPTESEKAINTLIHVVMEYCNGAQKMKKKAIKRLIQNELPEYFEAQKNDDLMKDLDANSEEEVDCREILNMLTSKVVAFYMAKLG